MSDSNLIEIMTVAGPEGVCLYVDNYRVCGPKPWGGGKTKDKFMVDINELYKALGVKLK